MRRGLSRFLEVGVGVRVRDGVEADQYATNQPPRRRGIKLREEGVEESALVDESDDEGLRSGDGVKKVRGAE